MKTADVSSQIIERIDVPVADKTFLAPTSTAQPQDTRKHLQKHTHGVTCFQGALSILMPHRPSPHLQLRTTNEPFDLQWSSNDYSQRSFWWVNKCDDDGLVLKQVRKCLRCLALNLSRGYATFSLFYIKLLSDCKQRRRKLYLITCCLLWETIYFGVIKNYAFSSSCDAFRFITVYVFCKILTFFVMYLSFNEKYPYAVSKGEWD